MTYATPPMQGTPMPAPPVQQMRPNAYRLPTNRSLTKFILLGLITFGIYDIVIMTTTAEALNTMAGARRQEDDGPDGRFHRILPWRGLQ